MIVRVAVRVAVGVRVGVAEARRAIAVSSRVGELITVGVCGASMVMVQPVRITSPTTIMLALITWRRFIVKSCQPSIISHQPKAKNQIQK